MTLRSWRAGTDAMGWWIQEMLQWGHDLAVMESLDQVRQTKMGGLSLQWGHDLAVMERGQETPPVYGRGKASMGP